MAETIKDLKDAYTVAEKRVEELKEKERVAYKIYEKVMYEHIDALNDEAEIRMKLLWALEENEYLEASIEKNSRMKSKKVKKK